MSFVENVMQNCEGSRGVWIRSLGCLVISNLMVNNTFQTSVIDADSNVTLLNNTLDNPDSAFELEAPSEGSASGRRFLDARTMTFGEAGPKLKDFSVSMGRWRVLLADRYRQALPSFQSNTVMLGLCRASFCLMRTRQEISSRPSQDRMFLIETVPPRTEDRARQIHLC